MIKPTHSRGQQLSEFLIDTVIVILIIIIIIIMIIIIIFISIKKGNSFRVVLGLVGKKHRSQVQVDALFILIHELVIANAKCQRAKTLPIRVY